MVCERKEPLTRPATAGESAVAGHPLPKGEGRRTLQGEGYVSDLGARGVQPKMWYSCSKEKPQILWKARVCTTCFCRMVGYSWLDLLRPYRYD